jgi:hypothetical protein
MLQPGLQLEQAPPISVPYRFFLSAPIFLVLAAAVLLWRGPEALESRLSPAALAVTHLFTLGFMSMVMMGAIMQLLPVLVGAPIRWPRTIATISHTGICFGTLSLAAGFLFSTPWLLKDGAVALGIAFAVFTAAVALSLWRSQVKNSTVRVIWLAVVSLIATAAFGVTLASSLGWGLTLPNASIRYLHPAWGLFGWAGLLAIGVAYQVVPMFQMTPRYPDLMVKYLVATVFLLLALWSTALWIGDGARGTWARACALSLATAYVVFAAMTIFLQQQRRRRLPDVTLSFWKLAMGSLIAANAIWALRIVSPLELPPGAEVLVGLLALLGCAGSIINGMLYKIMPFLAWFHLQPLARAGRHVPNMKKMLGVSDQRLQFKIHAAALTLLVAAVAWPAVLVYPAALALGAAGALLEVNLIKVLCVLRGLDGAQGASGDSAEYDLSTGQRQVSVVDPELAKVWAPLFHKKDALPEAEEFENVDGQLKYLQR